MSVLPLDGTTPALDVTRRQPGRDAPADWQVGQVLTFTVLERLDARHFLVNGPGGPQRVESELALRPGDRIETEVARVGARTELRFRRSLSGEPGAPGTPPGPEADTPVVAFADRYGVRLSAPVAEWLTGQTADLADPEPAWQGGLFLLQQGLPLTPPALSALTWAQAGTPLLPAGPSVEDSTDWERLADPVLAGDAGALDAAAEWFADALDGLPEPEPIDLTGAETHGADAAPGGTAGGGDGSDSPPQRDPRALANWLLNHTSDGGLRYGALPMLVGGELRELDLVYFQHPRLAADREPLRRLVMTLDTRHFGRVEVMAEAVDRRLLIRFASDSPDAAALADTPEDLRAVVERLGFAVDSIGYDLGRAPQRAARQVVQHALGPERFEVTV